MTWNFLNSKKQGDYGMTRAMAYFAEYGYTVSIPLTDSQDYDLVVDFAGTLRKVQIKTTSYIRNENYQVELRVKGGNQTGTGKSKNFDKEKVDYLYVLSSNGSSWLIPSIEINAKTILSLNQDFDRFFLGC